MRAEITRHKSVTGSRRLSLQMGSNQKAENVASNGADSILVTGGAGFIGSNFLLDWLAAGGGPVVHLDKLTSAGNPENLGAVWGNPAYNFWHCDFWGAGLVAGFLPQ